MTCSKLFSSIAIFQHHISIVETKGGGGTVDNPNLLCSDQWPDVLHDPQLFWTFGVFYYTI